MQPQGFNTGAKTNEVKSSAIVTRLENWHETYTRLNPWAHGGFIGRVIQRLAQQPQPSGKPVTHVSEIMTVPANNPRSKEHASRLSFEGSSLPVQLSARADVH